MDQQYNNNATPKSSNSEVHELRYRISQLEHLVVQNSLLNSSSYNNNSHNHTTTTSSLPSNSSLLHTPRGLVDRVNELEGLLAASEHDNDNLKRHLELLAVERNRQEVQLLEKVFRSDTEKKDLLHEKELLEIKLSKAQQKLDNIQDYVNDLPSQDELDEARATSSNLQEENQLLEGKLQRMLDNVKALQKDRMSLENTLRHAELKLEELKPLEEAQQAFFKDGELSPLDLTDTHKVTEFLTLQKAQLLRSSKIISSLRDKLFQLESDRADGLIKITNLESDIQSLQDQGIATQLRMDSWIEKHKSLEEEKIELQSENATLKHQIQQREVNLQQRDSHIHSLIQLVTEIDLSVKDVEKLVELGKSIALGQEPSISTLLGFNDEDFEEAQHNSLSSLCKYEEEQQQDNNGTSSTGFKSRNNFLEISKTCTDYNPDDPEWTLDRLVKIRTVRKHLRDLRDIASDMYTDILGGKVEGCTVQ